jgi:hypothetical protein
MMPIIALVRVSFQHHTQNHQHAQCGFPERLFGLLATYVERQKFRELILCYLSSFFFHFPTFILFKKKKHSKLNPTFDL